MTTITKKTTLLAKPIPPPVISKIWPEDHEEDPSAVGKLIPNNGFTINGTGLAGSSVTFNFKANNPTTGTPEDKSFEADPSSVYASDNVIVVSSSFWSNDVTPTWNHDAAVIKVTNSSGSVESAVGYMSA